MPIALRWIIDKTLKILVHENLINKETIKFFESFLIYYLVVYYQFVKYKYENSEKKEIDYYLMIGTKNTTLMTK